MGIPAYFSHVLKTIDDILVAIKEKPKPDVFFVDANSIIYDSLRELQYNGDDESFEITLMKAVRDAISDLYFKVDPKKFMFVSFDGVAPVAKLKQQQKRRYKSHMESTILPFISEEQDTTLCWNTRKITPGTKFMDNLMKFLNINLSMNPKIKLSSSNEKGEGEQKIFQHIRNNNMRDANVIIYGLDADLIMLSLANIEFCGSIKLYRETPEFIRQINSNYDPNTDYLLDIKRLQCELEDQCINKNIKDYVFFSFLIGNDFLPHFPSISIRSGGMEYLWKQYLRCNVNLINNDNSINWRSLKTFISQLANEEETRMIHGFQDRMKKKIQMSSRGMMDNKKLLQNMPILMNSTEQFINPMEDGWEERYYNKLLSCKNSESMLTEISKNYLSGLEWTWKYYTECCYDWEWYYKYNYPPLLKDLCRFIPYDANNYINLMNNDSVVNAITQLAIVLPVEDYDIIPRSIPKTIKNSDYDLEWSYCRYYWESHIISDFDYKSLNKKIEKYI